jgi:hypothetical protein
VVRGDGVAETIALLQAGAIGAASLVHVDPFDFHAAGPSAVSPIELVTRLAAAGIPTFAWYGLTAPPAAHELFDVVTSAAPVAQVWCAELRVGGPQANAAGVGPGCGVLFAAADLAPVESMRRVADAFLRAYNEQSATADSGVSVAASFVTRR